MKGLRKISDFIKLFGLIILIGTAGASDLGEMGTGEVISYIFLSFSIISFGGMLKEVSKLKFRKIKCSRRCEITRFPQRETSAIRYKRAI